MEKGDIFSASHAEKKWTSIFKNKLPEEKQTQFIPCTLFKKEVK